MYIKRKYAREKIDKHHYVPINIGGAMLEADRNYLIKLINAG